MAGGIDHSTQHTAHSTEMHSVCVVRGLGSTIHYYYTLYEYHNSKGTNEEEDASSLYSDTSNSSNTTYV